MMSAHAVLSFLSIGQRGVIFIFNYCKLNPRGETMIWSHEMSLYVPRYTCESTALVHIIVFRYTCEMFELLMTSF